METERRARETCSYLHCEPFILTLTAPSKAAAPALEAGGEARAQLSGGLRTGREEESPPPASHAASNATQGGRPAPKATLTGASQKRAAKADIHFAALTAGSCWCGWNRLQYPTPPPPPPNPISPANARDKAPTYTHTRRRRRRRRTFRPPGPAFRTAYLLIRPRPRLSFDPRQESGAKVPPLPRLQPSVGGVLCYRIWVSLPGGSACRRETPAHICGGRRAVF